MLGERQHVEQRLPQAGRIDRHRRRPLGPPAANRDLLTAEIFGEQFERRPHFMHDIDFGHFAGRWIGKLQQVAHQDIEPIDGQVRLLDRGENLFFRQIRAASPGPPQRVKIDS